MKELYALFFLSGCLAQIPSAPGLGGGPPGLPPLNLPNANLSGLPNMQGLGNVNGILPNMSNILPANNATGQGADQSSGGEGGTPNPLELKPNPTGPPANVNRPCRRYDLQCVRYFFKDHSHCKKPIGKVPEPYLHPLANQFYPAFNLTITNVNAYYTGFNTGRIQDLYVNRETDKVVIVIEFTDLRMATRDSFFRYHRRAREPIITYGYNVLEFPSLLLTVTIPQVDDLRLDKSDSFGYANTLPRVNMDPRLGESSDPVVAPTFQMAQTNLPILATENLLTQSSFFTTVFIQNVICDFGLKIALA